MRRWTARRNRRKLDPFVRGAAMIFLARCFSAAAFILLAGAAAQAASVKEVFEAHDLLGTWALDCAAQPSPQNPYVVFRPVENYVQRDTMAGATDRSDASVIDLAEDRKANEIMMR